MSANNQSNHPAARDKRVQVLAMNVMALAENIQRVEIQVVEIVAALSGLEDQIKTLVKDYTEAELADMQTQITDLAEREQ